MKLHQGKKPVRGKYRGSVVLSQNDRGEERTDRPAVWNLRRREKSSLSLSRHCSCSRCRPWLPTVAIAPISGFPFQSSPAHPLVQTGPWILRGPLDLFEQCLSRRSCHNVERRACTVRWQTRNGEEIVYVVGGSINGRHLDSLQTELKGWVQRT